MAIGDDGTMTEGEAVPPAAIDAAATHLRHEGMRATLELRVGRSFSFRSTVRATPAGLAAASGLAAAILVPAIWIIRGWKRGRWG